MDKRHAKLIVPRSLEFHMFQAAAQSALKIGEADADKYHILTDQDVDLTAQVEASGETETLDSLNVAVRSSSLDFGVEAVLWFSFLIQDLPCTEFGDGLLNHD